MPLAISRLLCLFGFAATFVVASTFVACLGCSAQSEVVSATSNDAKDDGKPKSTAKDIPEKVLKVLAYVDDKGEAMPGYEGGRNFGNFEKLLPVNDKNGKRIHYHEWDVNPLRKGVNRGVERLITGSDGSAYYTDDHYKTFKQIR